MKNIVSWIAVLVIVGLVVFGLIKIGFIVVPNISKIGCQPTCEKVHP